MNGCKVSKILIAREYVFIISYKQLCANGGWIHPRRKLTMDCRWQIANFIIVMK